MILAQIANTSYNETNLNRLVPQERELLKVEQFDNLAELVEECNPRERYVLIKNKVVLDPEDILLFYNVASSHFYDVISAGEETFDFFSLTGNAIKECEGDWSKLRDLGYSLMKIDKENKNAKNHNAKGTSSIGKIELG